MQAKVALVHDWLVTYRGGEKVLAELAAMYPEAPIYTLFYKPEAMPASLRRRRVIFPKWLQPLQFARKALLPVLPSIMESFDLSNYDLVISTSSCVAKGAMPAPLARHLCYIHSPMRYAWDQREHYAASLPPVPGVRALWNYMISGLRTWDAASSARVDKFIANSSFVQARVTRYYRRESSVIHPPVDVDAFAKHESGSDGYFIVAGAFVPYKRIEVAIRACESLGKRLIIAGDGPERFRLQKLAGRWTEFVIRPSDELLGRLLARADALLFPGIEDFGIVPIEAMASGTPVIALRGGGALDYIRQGETGMFFDEPTAESLVTILNEFRVDDFSLVRLREFAMQFSRTAFQDAMRAAVSQVLQARGHV